MARHGQKSARFPFPTRGIEQLAHRKNLKGGTVPGIAQVPGVTAFAGGLPIMTEDRAHIGGIGVSGGSADQDETCAQAGIDAAKDARKWMPQFAAVKEVTQKARFVAPAVNIGCDFNVRDELQGSRAHPQRCGSQPLWHSLAFPNDPGSARSPAPIFSASRITAGAAGFLTFSQQSARPER
jgi:hypothetical protein